MAIIRARCSDILTVDEIDSVLRLPAIEPPKAKRRRSAKRPSPWWGPA
jgi:hypothetical protein